MVDRVMAESGLSPDAIVKGNGVVRTDASPSSSSGGTPRRERDV